MATKVDVYFNLHKKCLSVRDCESRRVIAHVDAIALKQATFRVSESGRQRVLRDRRKNVHAFVRGYLDTTPHMRDVVNKCDVQVTYNPYKYDSFVRVSDTSPVKQASNVIIQGRVIMATGN